MENDKSLQGFALGKVRMALISGKLPSEAFQLGDHLTPFDLGLIRVGENTGTLEGRLQSLSELYAVRSERRSKVLNALLYPAVVLLLSLIVTAIMLTVVVPMFTGLYARFGKELPQLTKAVVWLSDHFAFIALFSAALIAAAMALFRLLLRSTQKERALKVLLKAPLLGPLVLDSLKQQVFYSLAALLHGQVPLDNALQTVSEAYSNPVIKKGLQVSKEQILLGQPAAISLERVGLTGPEETAILGVGEESGHLAEGFSELSLYFSDSMDSRSKVLTTLIEPLLILFLGTIVGTILIALYLPIFGLSSTIQ